MGTICSFQNVVLCVKLSVFYPYRDIFIVLCITATLPPQYILHCIHMSILSPHGILGHNSPTFLYEVIVRNDKKVNKSSGAGTSFSCGRDEKLQGCVESDGRDQVLLFNSQLTCMRRSKSANI